MGGSLRALTNMVCMLTVTGKLRKLFVTRHLCIFFFSLLKIRSIFSVLHLRVPPHTKKNQSFELSLCQFLFAEPIINILVYD